LKKFEKIFRIFLPRTTRTATRYVLKVRDFRVVRGRILSDI